MNLYLICFLGAIAQEILHWFDLRQDFGPNSGINKNSSYWLITIAATLLFTFATPILLEAFIKPEDIKDWHYFIGALSFPAIVKKLVKVLLNFKVQATAQTPRTNNTYTTKKYFK